MITRMDRDVGRIMELLRELGLEENTVVFFTSDNGGQGSGGPDLQFFNGNGPLRGAKGQLYEGGIRVPMIARWPGKIPAETVSDHIWAFDDVLPTLAEIGGTEPPTDIDGVSALPTLIGAQAAGHKQTQREYHYWETQRGHQAVRMGKWKALRAGKDKPLELYNLQTDIGESNNIADKHPEIAAKIETYLKTARTEPREYKKEPPTWGYKPEKTGYIK